jgi:hypothetical protein
MLGNTAVLPIAEPESVFLGPLSMHVKLVRPLEDVLVAVG